MSILVTGGLGYVGSIVTETLLDEGHRVIVVDNLQQGHREAVPPEAELIIGDICNPEVLDSVFRHHQIDAVVHLAAETVIEFSMTDPKRHFWSNVVGGMMLLHAMLKYGVPRLIFSSSAAVYGAPQDIPIEEEHPKLPVNAYGESKLVFERIMEWYGKAYGLEYVSFRYFNAAGATGYCGEDHRPETHLIPNVLRVAMNRNGPVAVFGTDYPTMDGSCIRDYVHVKDIARAHAMVLSRPDGLGNTAYNLSSGRGYSVLEVVELAREVIGIDIPAALLPRRTGDPPVLVASSQRAKLELGWEPECLDLGSIIDSAWTWMKEYPDGYGR